MAQSVKCPTLGLGSGLDLGGREFGPYVGLHAGQGVCLKKKEKKDKALA